MAKYAESAEFCVSAARLCSTVEFCLRLRTPAVISDTVNPILTQKISDVKFVDQILHPAFKDLSHLATQYQAIDALAPVFQTAMLAWVNRMPGGTPEPSARGQRFDKLGWTCVCAQCKALRGFLTSPGSSMRTTVRKLTSEMQDHVQSQLQEHVWLTSGFSVRSEKKSESCYEVCDICCNYNDWCPTSSIL